jgi:hypothetical protein
MNLDRAVVPSLVLALGVAVGGLLAGNGFAPRARRSATSRSKAFQREVRRPRHLADPLVGADNDLATANAKLTKSVAGVRAFLVKHGIDTTQIQITDSRLPTPPNQYNNAERRANRYCQTVLVRSNRPIRSSPRVSRSGACRSAS